MNKEVFVKRIKKYESILNNHIENKTTWVEENWFQIENLYEDDSIITIRFVFDEIRVEIGIVQECYSDKYEGMEFENGFSKFLKLLSCKIKRQEHIKGKYPFKVNYYFENNGVFELFGTAMTHISFKFWKKTLIKTNIQKPIVESDLIIKELNEIK